MWDWLDHIWINLKLRCRKKKFEKVPDRLSRPASSRYSSFRQDLLPSLWPVKITSTTAQKTWFISECKLHCILITWAISHFAGQDKIADNDTLIEYDEQSVMLANEPDPLTFKMVRFEEWTTQEYLLDKKTNYTWSPLKSWYLIFALTISVKACFIIVNWFRLSFLDVEQIVLAT